MRRLVTVLLVLVPFGVPAAAQSVLSICDYTPPESRVTSLSFQGNLQWYDGPFLDDRTRVLSATASAEYELLYSSDASGHRIDAFTELRGDESGWSFALRGDSDLKAFWSGDTFGLAAFGVDASNGGLEADLTAGLGIGRFRDVTPLAQATRIQNRLLDLGVLLAPLESDALLGLARILGDVDSTEDERTVALAEHLISTGLVKDGDLGVRALLAIEEILGSPEGGRLCGRDVQARVGLSATVMPDMLIATTGVVLYNFAIVPDPVSQLTSSGSCKARLARLEELYGELGATYSRSLVAGWTARASYRLTYDHGWSHPDEIEVGHVLAGSLTTQVLGSIGLSLAGELRYVTGDEEITSLLTVHLTYDLS